VTDGDDRGDAALGAASERGRLFAGVALTSTGVLLLQLTLTRLFSATLAYHFAFLAISLALLGSGAGGVAVYLAGERWRGARTSGGLCLFSLLFALSTVAALLVILANRFSPAAAAWDVSRDVGLLYLASAVPFFCAGVVLSLVVARNAHEMSRLYLFDLGGAAAGCLLLLPLLDRLGAPNTVLVVALLAAAAAVVFASGQDRRWMATASVIAALLGLLLAANAVTGGLDVKQAKGLPEAGNVIFSKWNSFSRVTVWGQLGDPSVLLMIDADAGTLILEGAGDPERHPWLARRVESLVHHLRPGGRTLVIGAGGGIDVASARLLGAREVVAVEVNPVVARDVMSSEPFLTYSGRLFERPGVRLVIDEARSFLRSRQERYDVIQATMVDTWAATAAGAYSLTENNLYTVEAFLDFLRRLGPEGVLSVTRWYVEPPDQVLRLAALARAAGAELGLGDVAAHVIVMKGVSEAGRDRAPATFLFGRRAFAPAEVDQAEALSAVNGFRVLFSPRTRPPGDLKNLLEAPDPATIWSALDRDLSPPRDNRPFFFQTVRLGRLDTALRGDPESRKTNLGTLLLFGLLALTFVLVLSCILLPLAWARGAALRAERPRKLRLLLGFAALGCGYIVLEVALVQKCILFLGSPAHALSVVLFSLLAAGALGSRFTARTGERPLRDRARRAAAIGAGAACVVVAVASPLFYACVQMPRPARVVLTVAVVGPLGFLLGRPLPLAVRSLARAFPEVVPWAWGVNGAASVLGSALALAVALSLGFDQALLLAGVLYVGTAVAFAALPADAR